MAELTINNSGEINHPGFPEEEQSDPSLEKTQTVSKKAIKNSKKPLKEAVKLAPPERNREETRVNQTDQYGKAFKSKGKNKEGEKKVIETDGKHTNFDPSKVKRDTDLEATYTLRLPTKDFPGVIIDNHQNKHINSKHWCGKYSGKSGNKYEGIQGPDESLRLFNHIVDNAPILQSYPKSPEAGNPKETYISFDVIAKDKDLSLIYKKHKNDQIAFHSHYDTGSRSWVMHSFPK